MRDVQSESVEKRKSLDGHAPSYSTMQIRTLKLLANVNNEKQKIIIIK